LTYPNEKGEPTKGFLEVDYAIGQVQQEAVWDGVIQADSAWAFPEEVSYKQRVRQARTKWRKLEPRAKELSENVNSKFTGKEINHLFVQKIVNHFKSLELNLIDLEG
jgi:hypothetical protein